MNKETAARFANFAMQRALDSGTSPDGSVVVAEFEAECGPIEWVKDALDEIWDLGGMNEGEGNDRHGLKSMTMLNRLMSYEGDWRIIDALRVRIAELKRALEDRVGLGSDEAEALLAKAP